MLHTSNALLAALVTSLTWFAGQTCAQAPLGPDALSASGVHVALAPPEAIPLPTSAQAAPSGDLTLVQIEEMAVAYHPAIREAAGQLRAARGNWLQVGLKPNPAIGYSGNEIGNEGQAGQQGGLISQELVTANKLGLNRAVASYELAAGEQRLEQVRLQVLTSARVGYFEMLAAERSVALATQLSQIAAQSARVSELRYKAQDIPKSSLLQSQIGSQTAALVEEQATARREAAWRTLAALVGLEVGQPRELEDVLAQPLPELEWNSTREHVHSGSPELAELRFAVDRARMAVDRAIAGRVPNVNLQAGAAFDDATNDTIANVQVSMPLPIFDRNQGAIAEARGKLAAARAALEERELALDQRLAAALRDYTTARIRVARYAESILPAARETLDMINSGYQQGELDYLQVLSVQQTYAQAHLTYLQDLETAWKKWAEIAGMLVGPATGSSQ